jgi:putative SOS response-associated peptidase YedK
MCYSAQIWSDYRKYIRAFGADIDFESFVDLFLRRQRGEKIVMPRGVMNAFKWCEPQNELEAQCQELARALDAQQVPLLQEALNTQRVRLAHAEAALAIKATKKASDAQRIATKKIQDLQRQLDDLERTEFLLRDDRMFAGNYCPVLTRGEDGGFLVRAMRYQCRPAGKPAFYDTKFPGTYNARRDNLQGFWKGVFGQTHAVVVATAFFEHVKRHDLEQRALAEGEAAEGVVLKFIPKHGLPMPMACLWSHWTGQDEPDLLSFALVTDEPPPEVLAAGHDRCPIPLTADQVGAWLATPGEVDGYDALLEDKDRPYFAHELAS